MEERLQQGRSVTILTAPSGFAYDLFQPMSSIATRWPEAIKRVRVVAADLDPHGYLAGELNVRAEKLGLRLSFLKGDLTSAEMRTRIAEAGPYDLALFVGLSAWLPKPPTARHLCTLRQNIREDGVLVSDCFTLAAYAISGRYVGYKATTTRRMCTKHDGLLRL